MRIVFLFFYHHSKFSYFMKRYYMDLFYCCLIYLIGNGEIKNDYFSYLYRNILLYFLTHIEIIVIVVE